MRRINQKVIGEPMKLVGIHSSGRCFGKNGNKNVYVDFGIPGETVTFSMGRRNQGFYSGQVIKPISPSPYRIVPFCGHYPLCGGCSWQHINYAHQLLLKRQILCNALEKYDIATPEVPQVIPSPQTLYFRHRMEYTFAASSYEEQTSDQSIPSKPALGFHLSGEPGKVIDIKECYLQADPSRTLCDTIKSFAMDHSMDFYDHENKTGFLRSLSIRVNNSGEVMVLVGFYDDRPELRNELLNFLMLSFPQIVSLCWTIHLSHTHSQLQGEIIPFGDTKPFIHETLAGYRFRIQAGSFFQPNVLQAEQILLTAKDWTELSGNEKVYDLYTGVGTIALFLASMATHITGIEGSSGAIEDAQENTSLNGIRNVEFLTGDILETFKSGFLAEHGKPDLVVLDPPRSGTLIEIKKTINTSGANKVLYLSCNPVSLAFDLKQLTEVYKVTRIQSFDMLPHTHHLETLVMLEKNNSFQTYSINNLHNLHSR
jgi:23S rRNA (uracil1939-C5)-methyltransferase